MSRGRHFYKDGIRFECQGDGKCCMTRGKYGYVYLSFGDRKRLAAHFNISTTEFTTQYTRKADGMYELKYTSKDCPFFENNKCSVYEARPWQCRTWPFWSENMNTATWEKEVSPYCPGVGTGRLYTEDEISDILAKKKDVA